DQKTPKAKTGELLSDYAATWDGYVEAFKFKSGSDRLRIELDEEGHGVVALGGAEPLAPASDPESLYAPIPLVSFSGDPDGPFQLVPDVLAEGFAYTVQHAEVQEKRIQFGIDSRELYKSWCELQTPVHNTAPVAPEYGCLPYYDTSTGLGIGADAQCYINDYVTGELVEVNCAKMPYCGPTPVCSCTASGCTVAPL